MNVFGVDFVPLSESLDRRLQTLAAASSICTLVLLGPVGCAIALWCIVYGSFARWLVVFYYIVIYFFDWDTHERGGWSDRWTRWMRTCNWWRYYCDYFPIKIVKTVDLDPSRNYLFCSFPHGLMGAGIFGVFVTEFSEFRDLFPGLRGKLMTLVQNFKQPLFREYLYSLGGISASRKSIEHVIRTPGGGMAAVLVVGGSAECLYCDGGPVHRVVLSRRKGFVKIALENGTPLVPVFTFGELDLYGQVKMPNSPYWTSFQTKFRQITGYTLLLPIGVGIFQNSFGLVPRRRPLTVVVGAPLEVPKISNPTEEDVIAYRTKFVERLQDLFEKHKHRYLKDPEKAQLLIE